jgi:hypothetical protein
LGVPRRIEWALTALTAVIAVPLFAARGGTPRTGKVIQLTVTPTPEDEGGLECSLPKSIGEHRCAYRTARSRWDDPPARSDLIRPFVAIDGDVYLLSGLFEDGSVRAHMRRNPRARFTASCKVHLLDTVTDVAFRFHPTDRWLPPDYPLYIGEVRSCHVE